MEDDLNGRQSNWKTSSMEDDLKGITPLLKNILMEVNLTQWKPYRKQMTLVSLASKFSSELGPAQPQLVLYYLQNLQIKYRVKFYTLKENIRNAHFSSNNINR